MAQQQEPKFESMAVMKYEWMRLASFANFPLESPVHTTRLAEAGFYYQGHEDEVTCFSCGVKHKGWTQGDVPVYIHRNLSQHCSFLNGSGTGNVGIKESSWDFAVNRKENNHPSVPVSNKGTTKESSSESNQENNVNARAETPHDTKQTNGACGGPKDVANTITTNLANEERSVTNAKRSHVPQSTRQVEKKDLGFQLEPLGISFERPVYPQYAITTTRISSFKKWPKDKKQCPEELAKAGLFHEGVDDRVRCFFCGGGLFHWDPEDDPWIEHARWYPRCVYLRQSKGDEFIHKVQAEVQHESQDLPHLKDKEVKTRSGAASKQYDNLLFHPASLSVLEMGVNPVLLKKALREFLETNDSSNLAAEKLLVKVWEIEEKEVFGVIDDSSEANKEITSTLSAPGEIEGNETVSNKTSYDLSNRTAGNKSADQAERIAIMEENRHLKELQICKICLDEDVSIVFLPCGHMASCASCAPALRKCPICRTFIKGTVKAIIS